MQLLWGLGLLSSDLVLVLWCVQGALSISLNNFYLLNAAGAQAGQNYVRESITALPSLAKLLFLI
jgi:hypothetical protein